MTQLTLTDGIVLLNGASFNFLDPEACERITINDIAGPLSNICRFAGQLPYFYSVAQHAVNACWLAPKEHKFTALMHDTSEAFTNDIVTPLKHAVPLFKRIEEKIEANMAERFGFTYPLPPEVKLVDRQMLALEMAGIRDHDPSDHAHLNGVEFKHLLDEVDLISWSPHFARQVFLEHYEEYRP